MDRTDRRSAKQAWRERTVHWEIVAIRIGDRAWVKLTPDAAALANRFGFLLRQGGGRGLAPDMAEAYKEVGEVRFEGLERLDADLSEMARERVGRERLDHWAATLGATAI